MDPREHAAALPEKPGVYLFKDASGTVLYVGKAASLRSRVRSYFLESSWANAKTGSLAREIAELETIVVDNEHEALALEHNLIKQYQPKFNVLLRDDKTYPLHQAHDVRKISTRLLHPKSEEGWRIILWPIFPRRFGAPHPAFHSQAVFGAILLRGPNENASTAMLAVLHQALPGALCARAHHG